MSPYIFQDLITEGVVSIYLDDILISHNKVEMDLVKIAGVVDWPTPSNKQKVQSFIGFVNFYQCFMPGFSHHAHTLFDLTMKDVRFIWGLPQEDSFMKLKELITSAPVRVLPNTTYCSY
jgi:hypothetical protein